MLIALGLNSDRIPIILNFIVINTSFHDLQTNRFEYFQIPFNFFTIIPYPKQNLA